MCTKLATCPIVEGVDKIQARWGFDKPRSYSRNSTRTTRTSQALPECDRSKVQLQVLRRTLTTKLNGHGGRFVLFSADVQKGGSAVASLLQLEVPPFQDEKAFRTFTAIVKMCELVADPSYCMIRNCVKARAHLFCVVTDCCSRQGGVGYIQSPSFDLEKGPASYHLLKGKKERSLAMPYKRGHTYSRECRVDQHHRLMSTSAPRTALEFDQNSFSTE